MKRLRLIIASVTAAGCLSSCSSSHSSSSTTTTLSLTPAQKNHQGFYDMTTLSASWLHAIVAAAAKEGKATPVLTNGGCALPDPTGTLSPSNRSKANCVVTFNGEQGVGNQVIISPDGSSWVSTDGTLSSSP